MIDIPDSLKLGSTGSITRVLSDEVVQHFAQLSGDTQPLHLNDDYAGQTRFGRRIAHGALLVGMVSAVLGVEMADSDFTVIFLGLDVRFVQPVFIGDTVTVNCEVTDVREDKPIVTLATVCKRGDNETVMTGNAVVYVDPHPAIK